LIGTAAITDYMPTFSLYEREGLERSFDEVLHTNVLGHILMATAARSALLQSSGSIILTLSTSGIYPGGQGVMYSVSKAALAMVVKQLAYELAPKIRVNGVVPGVVGDSDIRGPAALGQENDTPNSLFPQLQAATRQMNPLRICPSGSAYTGIYALLASRRDGAVSTGAILNWDSGIGLVGHGTAFDESLETDR
jgi:NAD(P)-dependent dehydrogenase (short-subunit alcohol dehydrogenase family)